MTEMRRIAQDRHTLKVLGDPSTPLPATGLARATVEELVEVAGWAPFHRAAHRAREGDDPVCEPWRFTMLDAPACRKLLGRLDRLPGNPGKVANMLAVADALVLATWLPEPSTGDAWEATDFNMEHIAAAAAAVQTLLLAATEQGIRSYWSSGGVLGSRQAFDLLGIQPRSVLIGAVFLFPEPPDGVEAVSGKLRSKRSPARGWSRWASPD